MDNKTFTHRMTNLLSSEFGFEQLCILAVCIFDGSGFYAFVMLIFFLLKWTSSTDSKLEVKMTDMYLVFRILVFEEYNDRQPLMPDKQQCDPDACQYYSWCKLE